MKNIEWLKKEIKDEEVDLKYAFDNYVPYEKVLIADDVNELLSQLDEPETLSQEWIDENKVARINDLRKMTTSDVVPVEKLENLLVPKQEKPVIPQFVVDWIDTHNLCGNNPLREYRDLENDFNEGWTDEKDAAVYHWINKNPYAFIDVLRYGYEVEKEPQWVVRYEDGYFSEEIKFGCGIDGDWVDEVSRAYHFTDKAKAEAVSLLIGGTVEEVTPCN